MERSSLMGTVSSAEIRLQLSWLRLSASAPLARQQYRQRGRAIAAGVGVFSISMAWVRAALLAHYLHLSILVQNLATMLGLGLASTMHC